MLVYLGLEIEWVNDYEVRSSTLSLDQRKQEWKGRENDDKIKKGVIKNQERKKQQSKIL